MSRTFPFTLRAWDSLRLRGFVGRETWREVALRGLVPIIALFQGRECYARVDDAGEHHLHIDRLTWEREELGLPDYSDHEALFRIDWDRAVPERMAAEIVRDAALGERWRSLSYPEACDLIAPVRRARSAASVARREAEAIKRLRGGRNPS